MGRWNSTMTSSQWRKAFIEEHGADTTRMRESAQKAGIDVSKLRWDGSADVVAAEVLTHVEIRFHGGAAIRMFAALVGGRDEHGPQCACGKH